MTIEFSRRHWAIFIVFLLMQLFGITVIATRGGVVRDGWIYLGWFAVPNVAAGWMGGAGLLIGGCFVDAVIVGRLWDSLRPSKTR